MELLSAVGEGNKHGWRDRCLCEVVKLQGLAPRARGAWYTIEIQVSEETIHLRRGHAEAPGFRYLRDRVQESSEAEPSLGGNEDEGRVIQVFHPATDGPGILGGGSRTSADSVPFVD